MLVYLRYALAVMLCSICASGWAEGDFSTAQAQTDPTLNSAPQESLSLTPSRGISSLNPPQAAPYAKPADASLKPASAQIPPVNQAVPIEETEFQKFIAASIGKRLPMFGYDTFSASPTTFAPVDHVPVTPDYTVGPGDEVDIRVWGQIDADLHLQVDRLGQIYIPKVGNLNVSGLKYQDLKSYIRTAVGRNFRNFNLEVNLGQLRSIQIYVVGQARRPGSYTVSALSTLVNALFASGGPSGAGSMRHIQLKRQDKIVTEFDVYDFLLEGDKSKDAHLQAGDVIYIPPVGQVAAITGSINVPAIYELKDKTDLARLIAMAGGLTTTAAGQKVEVERIENRKDRVVDDFDLDQAGLARQLKDGDLVKVIPISPEFKNAVTLRGNVAFPFRYPWHQGMRVTDIIPDKDVLITADYWRRQNMTNQDKVSGVGGIFGQNTTNRDKIFGVAGAFGEIRRSIPEINWDYAVVERLDWSDLRTRLIPFNLGKAVLDKDPSQNLELQPGDVVTVFSKDEMKVSVEKQTRLVTIEGEVKNDGVFEAKPGETLRQLVARLGGLTDKAYLFGAEFTRESTRKLQQQRLEESIDRMERDVRKNAATSAQSAMDQKGMDAAKQQATSQQAALEKLRQAKATGRIVLEIPPEADALKDIPDVVLENGDRLFVPAIPSTVGVFGEVYNENNAFFYKQSKRVSDYLSQAGGPTRDADADRIFVLRADGSVISSQSDRGFFSSSFEGMRLMPGDAVVVPEKLDKTPILKSILDWSQMIVNMGVSLATLKFIGVI
ncbi:MAG: Polysaccharide export protein [Candidatus Gallionella acididurans]|uniref:Polysaccharide export protein n=1 Tax=Candidatus Gallionella acididurans TaxID=1796491 RepID=A0A139BW91_9PROT|nr:MAG: Polysaccharide export protein [Candidatus Gallionella acididurans]